MWLWILLITALIAAAFIFTVSWMLVKLVITPERSSLEEVEQLEIERGNFAPGEEAPQIETGHSYHDRYERYAAPIVNRIFGVLDKVRDGLGLN